MSKFCIIYARKIYILSFGRTTEQTDVILQEN